MDRSVAWLTGMWAERSVVCSCHMTIGIVRDENGNVVEIMSYPSYTPLLVLRTTTFSIGMMMGVMALSALRTSVSALIAFGKTAGSL